MKKFLSVILSVFIIITVLPMGVFAASDNIELDVYREVFVKDENGGEHMVVIDKNGREVQLDRAEYLNTSSVTLPASYDARAYDRVTSVKNQSPYETCWSFAFCSAAESSLISQGYETKDSVDLSEAHLAWFGFKNYVEGSNIPAQLDYRIPNTDNVFNNGAQFYEAFAAVSRWSGFANEADYPYVNTTDSSAMEFPAEDMFVNNYNLTSVLFYPRDQVDAIKSVIMRNGAIATSYFSDQNNYNRSVDGYCYYQSEQTGSNHAITVVGWDDNFPATDFKTTPEGNGAWLVKNSWDTRHGDAGYFWLSYYDTSIDDFTEVNAKPSGDYDSNYQYDGTYCVGTVSFSSNTGYTANVFTAESLEKVSAASFQLAVEAPYECTVSLYTDLANASVPTSGALRESKTVTCSRKGFYTVDFDNKYDVMPGETFSVVVKFTNLAETGKTYFKTEYKTAQFSYHSDRGQSFISSNGSSWSDCVDNGVGNIPIKAFTVNASGDEYASVESIEIVSLPKTSYYEGQAIDLTGMVVKANYADGTQRELNAGEYTVRGFDSTTAGTKTITISCGDKTASFNVTVEPVVADHIEIASYPKTVYYIGDEFSYTGLSINIYYNDGSVRRAASCSYEYPRGLTETPGVKTVKIYVGDLETEYQVTVLAVEVTGIELMSPPDKVSYTQLDSEIDTTGLALRVTYNNGSTEEITTGYTLSGFDTSTEGTKSIIVSYAGFTAEFDIEVSFVYADYTAVYNAVSHANEIKASDVRYTEESMQALEEALNNVVSGLTSEHQAEVDGYAQAIEDAIDALVEYYDLEKVVFGTIDTLAAVDHENMVIYGLAFGITDISKYVIVAEGFSYECTSFGTGSEFAVYKNDKKIASYQLVIFGDINGDGWADGRDATIADCISQGLITKENIGYAAYMAADCTHDGVIDADDVELLTKAGIFLESISQYNGDDENTGEYEEYMSLISQSIGAGETIEIDDGETDAVDEAMTYSFFKRLYLLVKFLLSLFVSVK